MPAKPASGEIVTPAKPTTEDIVLPEKLAALKEENADADAKKDVDADMKVKPIIKDSDESDPIADVVSLSKEESKETAPEKPSKPLALRIPSLEKKIRLLKTEAATKILKRFEKDAVSIKASALKEMDKITSDTAKLVERRNRESVKRLLRVKDTTLRSKLETKLRTEFEKTNTSNTKYMADQKTVMEKLIDEAFGDMIKKGLDLIEKGKEKQAKAVEKLTALGPKMHDKIQSNFAALSKVMDEIVQAS